MWYNSPHCVISHCFPRQREHTQRWHGVHTRSGASKVRSVRLGWSLAWLAALPRGENRASSFFNRHWMSLGNNEWLGNIQCRWLKLLIVRCAHAAILRNVAIPADAFGEMKRKHPIHCRRVLKWAVTESEDLLVVYSDFTWFKSSGHSLRTW